MINIAMDGHVGSGKSTLAKALAKRLGYKVFETGAIYRAIACEYMQQGLDQQPTNEIIHKFAQNLDVKVKFSGDRQIVLVNGHDYSDSLRLEKTSVMSGIISPFEEIREKTKNVQRDYAKSHNVIMEGRDIATVVLPDAQFKFFVTASEEVRAQRRYEQVCGQKNSPSFQEILKDLRDRDYRDEHREICPLKPAPDSIIIDNTNMTLEQTVDKCMEYIEGDNSKNTKKIIEK